MLFDPPKEQFHLPPRFVELWNREGGQREIIGEQRQPLRRRGIDVAHTPQWCGIDASGRGRGQADRVIRLQAGRELDGTRRASSELNPFLRAGHEEGCFVGEAMEAFEVEVAALSCGRTAP